MPFVRAFVPQDLSDDQVAAISRAIHTSLVETVDVPTNDRFQVITRQPANTLFYAPEYLGIKHGSKVVMMQIYFRKGRTLEKKKALYAALASSIAETGAVEAKDVIIALIENEKEDWSFGEGIAQYTL
jgi:phenylpyruvate tautomerase PptA (4-oxalocrotonate tautomerase family)